MNTELVNLYRDVFRCWGNDPRTMIAAGWRLVPAEITEDMWRIYEQFAGRDSWCPSAWDSVMEDVEDRLRDGVLPAGNINRWKLYNAALHRWGFDAQALVLAKECCALSADVSRMLLHRPHNMAQECADVEIMLEQMRHSGMDVAIDREKERRLARLALLVEGCGDIDVQEPVAVLRQQAHDIEYAACDDYAELQAAMMEGNHRLAERYARKTAGRLLHLAQTLGRLARQRPGNLDEGTNSGDR